VVARCQPLRYTRWPMAEEVSRPARAHGGRDVVEILLVDDNDDLRAVLRVLLSRQGCPAAEATEEASAIEAPRRGRPGLVLADAGRDVAEMLLVDDNDAPRAVLRVIPSRQGYQVAEAPDEPSAIEALRRSRPALVLSGLRLPVGDGLGVLRAAKDLDPTLPVV